MKGEKLKSKAVVNRQLEAAQKELEELNKRQEEKAEALKKLLAEKKQLDALAQAKADAAERKRVERKKFLIGAMMLKRMGADPAFSSQVMADLNIYLDKNRDRAVFELTPISAPVASPKPVQSPESRKSANSFDDVLAVVEANT